MILQEGAVTTRVINIRRDAAEVQRATAAGTYVYGGRGRGSKWGNPFTHRPNTLAKFVVPRDEVLPRYEAWLRAQPHLMAALGELRGKVLGCFCKPGTLSRRYPGPARDRSSHRLQARAHQARQGRPPPLGVLSH